MSTNPKHDDSIRGLLEIYNDIDTYMRKELNVNESDSHMRLIEQMAQTNKVFYRNQDQLRALAKLRNLIVHNPFKAIDPVTVPNEGLVNIYGSIRDKLLRPAKAISIAIPGPSIATAKLTDNSIEIIKMMANDTFTHIPIVKDDKMIGVFSENTILSYMADRGEFIITGDSTMQDFADFIPFDKHKSETFKFISRDALLEEVYGLFNAAIKIRERVGVVYITENGKPDQKLLGMITPWDIANQDNWSSIQIS